MCAECYHEAARGDFIRITIKGINNAEVGSSSVGRMGLHQPSSPQVVLQPRFLSPGLCESDLWI